MFIKNTGPLFFNQILDWRCIVIKKLEIIIRPDKFEDVKGLLNMTGHREMTFSSVVGLKNQRSIKELNRDSRPGIDFLHKIKIEVIVSDKWVERIISRIKEILWSNTMGDEKVFIYSSEEVVKITSNES